MPLAARHAHEELEDTPCIDKGFYVLMGNNHYVMQSIKDGDRARLKNFIAWLLSASKGFAPKLVNPGGVEVWKQKQAGNVSDLNSVVDHFDVTPRQIIGEVCRAANELGQVAIQPGAEAAEARDALGLLLRLARGAA